jgi:hypothetical protein
MFRKLPVVLMIILVLALSHVGFGQNISIQIILSPILKNARIVYVASFDFLQQGSAQFLFQLNINNQTGGPVPGKLRFILEKNEEEIARATSNEFDVPSGFSTVNNIQLSNGYIFPGTQREVKFSDSEIKTPSDEFEKEMNEGGKLPTGIYIFRAEIIEPFAGTPIGPASAEKIEVVNTAYVQPITPGRENDLTNPEILFTEFPVFQFNTNLIDIGGVSDPYNIKVFKVLSDLHQSLDDISTTTPHLEMNTNLTAFQYPQVGGPGIIEYQPLEPGTYAWQVTLVVPTTSGEDYEKSPFYVFRIVDPSALMELQAGQAAAEEVLRLLRTLMGDQADEIANALSGFMLEEIRHEGSVIELNELYRLITAYQGQPFQLNYIDLSPSQ